jgi:hypothetical protein
MRLYGADVVEWSMALDIRLSDWCINSVSSNPRRGKNKNLTAQKSNSNTVWFNFQMYIYIVCFTCHMHYFHSIFCVRIRFLSCQIFVLPSTGIWTHTIDTLQHQSLSLKSNAIDHSTTSAPYREWMWSSGLGRWA